MKDSLLAPLFLVLNTLLLFLVALLISGVALTYSNWLQEGGVIGLSPTLIPDSFDQVREFLPIIIGLGFFSLLFRLRNRPGKRPLTFVLMWLIAVGLFYSGHILLSPLESRESGVALSAPLLAPGKINRIPTSEGSMPMIFSSRNGNEIEGVVAFGGREPFRIRHYRDGLITPDVVTSSNGREILPPRTIIYSDFPYDFGVASIPVVGEFLDLGVGFMLQESHISTLIAAICLSLYLVGCWGLIRLTRWSLLNLCITLFALRVAGWIYTVFASPMIIELVEVVVPVEVPIGAVAFMGFAVGGVILILLDLIFVRYNQRIMEDADG